MNGRILTLYRMIIIYSDGSPRGIANHYRWLQAKSYITRVFEFARHKYTLFNHYRHHAMRLPLKSRTRIPVPLHWLL
jgi:hypothetical protein